MFIWLICVCVRFCIVYGVYILFNAVHSVESLNQFRMKHRNVQKSKKKNKKIFSISRNVSIIYLMYYAVRSLAHDCTQFGTYVCNTFINISVCRKTITNTTQCNRTLFLFRFICSCTLPRPFKFHPLSSSFISLNKCVSVTD